MIRKKMKIPDFEKMDVVELRQFITDCTDHIEEARKIDPAYATELHYMVQDLKIHVNKLEAENENNSR